MSIPSVTLESITFSDGQTILLNSDDIVVFVGANNTGKSAALRDINNHVRRSNKGIVVSDIKLCRIGSSDEVLKYIKIHTSKNIDRNNTIVYTGQGEFSVAESNISRYWNADGGLDQLSPFFCMLLETERRIIDSNPVASLAIPGDNVIHPIQMLYCDDKAELRISGYFHRAFGEHLIVHRSGGKNIPLLVGERIAPQDGEDRISLDYLERLYNITHLLSKEGDGMRSFASMLLHLLAPTHRSVLLVDEPEAFLHPPQARLIGELIASKRRTESQLFIATHSQDILNGLLSVASEKLRVLRIERDANVNHVKELDNERAREISTDPLMKYSSVLSGVFYKRVIICEGDSDCTFYNSILHLSDICGKYYPDVLFIHAGGKDRMYKLAEALIELGVRVDIIADIDILKSEDIFEKTITMLGADWRIMKTLVTIITSNVENNIKKPNVEDITNDICAVINKFNNANTTQTNMKDMYSEIRDIFSKISPWDNVKKFGESAIPKGDATKSFKELKNHCKKLGLWMVPVGELEGFYREFGKQGWVQNVLELGQEKLATHADFRGAREFVKEIWHYDRTTN